MVRITKDDWAIALASITASRSTCLRRQVGCILLNSHGHVLATGYNGAASGLPHCNEGSWDHCGECGEELQASNMCMKCGHINSDSEPAFPHACKSKFTETGEGPDDCHAIHAEQNALLQCRDVWTIHKCVVTRSPCPTCVKLLLNTSCKIILFRDQSSHAGAGDIWRAAGRTWARYTIPKEPVRGA